jgi:hypothetical protein
MSDYPALARDARALSSGTMSYLVNDTRYSVVDQVQADFVEFFEENPRYENWVKAWEDFSKVYDFNKISPNA